MGRRLEEAFGGLCSGVVGTGIGYPLDVVKTRMQTSSSDRGMGKVMTGILRKEGFVSLYKGILPPLMSLSILNTIIFPTYACFREVYKAERGWDYRNALAGGTAGPIAGVVSTVEHMLKTQMQLDNVGLKQYRSSYHCFTSLVKSHGVRILYTGHTVNVAREIAFISSYFFIYEGLKETFVRNAHISTQFSIPIAGGCAGAAAWFISFPLDCVKAGIQGEPVNVQKRNNGNNSSAVIRFKPKSAFEVAKKLLQTKGIRGMYSGVTPTLTRAFLVSGTRFSTYEFALWLLR